MASSGNDRDWTDASGAFHLHGSFVAVKDGQVQIRRADDSLVSVKLSQLARSDQLWVERRLAEIRQANEAFSRFPRPAPLPTSLKPWHRGSSPAGIARDA